MHGQFAGFDRPAQQALDTFAFPRIGRHLGRIKITAAAAIRLGLVHRRVGIAHQRIDVLTISRIQADANAGGDEQFVLEDIEGQGQEADQFVGNMAGLGCIPDIFDDADEFVATKPGQRIRSAQMAGKAMRHGDQQLVAYRVAEGVVHFLEAVEVDEQDGQLAAGARCQCEAVLQLLDEHQPVRQASQRVVMGQMVETFLGIAALDHLGLQFFRAPLDAMVEFAVGFFERFALLLEDALRAPYHEQLEEEQQGQYPQHDEAQADVFKVGAQQATGQRDQDEGQRRKITCQVECRRHAHPVAVRSAPTFMRRRKSHRPQPPSPQYPRPYARRRRSRPRRPRAQDKSLFRAWRGRSG